MNLVFALELTPAVVPMVTGETHVPRESWESVRKTRVRTEEHVPSLPLPPSVLVLLTTRDCFVRNLSWEVEILLRVRVVVTLSVVLLDALQIRRCESRIRLTKHASSIAIITQLHIYIVQLNVFLSVQHIYK